MGNYQLKVRKSSNPENNITAEMRARREWRKVERDAGLEETWECHYDEFQESKTQYVDGCKIVFYPRSRRKAKNEKKCDLPFCGKAFVQNATEIIGAELNNLGMNKRKKKVLALS